VPERSPSRAPLLPAWAVVTPARAAHIARVAALLERWVVERGVGAAEAERWRRAAWLHDALRDATPGELARWTPQDGWPVALWHGPAAAAAAAAHGETDAGVLDAVRYHSIGWPDWDDAGRMLFLADYLEPGRPHDRERRAAWAARAGVAPAAVLREVLDERITWARERGRPLRQETLDLWTQVAGDDSSSSD
jgi:HD superfamily phosphohydrolase YqeK